MINAIGTNQTLVFWFPMAAKVFRGVNRTPGIQSKRIRRGRSSGVINVSVIGALPPLGFFDYMDVDSSQKNYDRIGEKLYETIMRIIAYFY